MPSGMGEVFRMRKAPTARTVRAFDCQLSHEINNMISIATSISTINVPFHGVSLFVVNYNGEPFTPMKPIVEGMGMNWASQFTKLKQRFSKGIAEITIPSAGGSQSMTCLALRKLNGWLQTISPNKVKPEIRDRVIQYQEECDDVLYKYWVEGTVVNPRRPVGRPRKKTTVDERTPLRDAINMLVGKKGLRYDDAYNIVHQRFAIESIDELEPSQIPQAVEYVHRVVLDGEFLRREKATDKPIPVPNFKDGEWVIGVKGGEVVESKAVREGEFVISYASFKEIAERAGNVIIGYNELLTMTAKDIIRLASSAEKQFRYWDEKSRELPRCKWN